MQGSSSVAFGLSWAMLCCGDVDIFCTGALFAAFRRSERSHYNKTCFTLGACWRWQISLFSRHYWGAFEVKLLHIGLIADYTERWWGR